MVNFLVRSIEDNNNPIVLIAKVTEINGTIYSSYNGKTATMNVLFDCVLLETHKEVIDHVLNLWRSSNKPTASVVNEDKAFVQLVFNDDKPDGKEKMDIDLDLDQFKEFLDLDLIDKQTYPEYFLFITNDDGDPDSVLLAPVIYEEKPLPDPEIVQSQRPCVSTLQCYTPYYAPNIVDNPYDVVDVLREYYKQSGRKGVYYENVNGYIVIHFTDDQVKSKYDSIYELLEDIADRLIGWFDNHYARLTDPFKFPEFCTNIQTVEFANNQQILEMLKEEWDSMPDMNATVEHGDMFDIMVTYSDVTIVNDDCVTLTCNHDQQDVFLSLIYQLLDNGFRLKSTEIETSCQA